MSNDRSTLIGQVLGERYPLTTLELQSGGRAVFQSGADAIVEVAPSTDEQLSRWQKASRLSHPGLLRILDTGTAHIGDEQLAWCAVERPDDRLDALLQERPMKEEEASEVLDAVRPCLEYLHGHGFVHGGVHPRNIVAAGTSVKLMPTTIRKGDPADDWRDLERAIDRMFHGKVPPRFMQTRVQPVAPPPPVPSRPGQATAPEGRIPMPTPQRRSGAWGPSLWVAGFIVIAALLFLYRGMRNADPVTQATTPAAARDDRPTPVAPKPEQETQRARTVIPPQQPAATPPAAPVQRPSVFGNRGRNSEGGDNWSVIAATYRNYDAAAKRAESIRKRFSDCDCTVYPREGQGQRYYVMIGSGLTRDAADRLLRRAWSFGAPRDAYVTKIAQ